MFRFVEKDRCFTCVLIMRAGSFLEGKPDPLALLKTKLIEDGRTSSLFASTLPPGFCDGASSNFRDRGFRFNSSRRTDN